MNGHAETVTLLIGMGANLEQQRKMLGAPLHAAARRGHAAAAPLKGGADPDVRNRDEFTPMMRAVIENRAELAELLIREGADINAIGIAPGGAQIGNGSTTAPHLAILCEDQEIEALLHRAGAEPIPPDAAEDLLTNGDPDQGHELAYAYCEKRHTMEPSDPPRTGSYSPNRL